MTRRLSREEGRFVGWSSGSAVHGAVEYARENLKKDDLMVILLRDHGMRYLDKVYNDYWMKDDRFLDTLSFISTARDSIRGRNGNDSLTTVDKQAKVSEAILLMNREGIDQIPVTENEHFVGSISSSGLLEKIMEDPQLKNKTIGEVMDKPMQFVAPDSTLDVLSSFLNKENKAVLVRDESQHVHIITRHDVLKALTN